MVPLTRLTGVQFALNPDLIERVDCTPDTVITLVDGTKYLVQETLGDIVSIILEYRAQILVLAGTLERSGDGVSRRSRLSAVPTDEEQRAGEDVPVLPLSPRRQQ
jgi:flagellar protein FlbD